MEDLSGCLLNRLLFGGSYFDLGYKFEGGGGLFKLYDVL